jgi:hypothetical protein
VPPGAAGYTEKYVGTSRRPVPSEGSPMRTRSGNVSSMRNVLPPLMVTVAAAAGLFGLVAVPQAGAAPADGKGDGKVVSIGD